MSQLQLPIAQIRASPAPQRQPRGSRSRFASPYDERRGEPISFRLPISLDLSLRSAVGWRSSADNPRLKAAVENALLLWLNGNGAND